MPTPVVYGYARSLLDALALPQASAAVILNASHLSPRPQSVGRFVDCIRRQGCVVRFRDGGLPDVARK